MDVYRTERRMYRKSPGRQYGYEYDPLRSETLNGYNQAGRSNAVKSEPWHSRDETGSRGGRHTSGLLAPRPNPRRTRQLLRQNIIASKSKSAQLEDTGQLDPELRGRYALTDEDQRMYEGEGASPLYRNRYPRSSQLLPPEQERYIEEEEEEFNEEPYADEELQYMDPDPGYDEYEDYDPLAQRLNYSETPQAKSSGLRVQPETPARGRRRSEPLDYDSDEQEEAPARRKGKKKKGLTRRKWLAAINADNASLAALQAVLQNWVGQAKNMPKKLQTITETDLDGAQAYLRALQRKIQEEQAKLNGQGTTPTPAPTTKANH